MGVGGGGAAHGGGAGRGTTPHFLRTDATPLSTVVSLGSLKTPLTLRTHSVIEAATKLSPTTWLASSIVCRAPAVLAMLFALATIEVGAHIPLHRCNSAHPLINFTSIRLTPILVMYRRYLLTIE